MLENAIAVPAEPQFITINGNQIAVRFQVGNPNAPTLVWLGGYNSDMRGTKAERLADLATAHDISFLRFDYSGHGESGGKFEDGTISSWLKDAEAVIANYAGSQKLILVGSSMGAWITLRLVQNLIAANQKHRLAGLVLLAPAPDFTTDLVEPKLTEFQRHDLTAKKYCEEPSAYGPEPTIYTLALIEDGRKNRVMTGIIDTHCNVTILQGMADTDVPYSHALKLVSHLPQDNVTLTLIKDGDHRLSREQDLVLLESAVLNHLVITGVPELS
ncbi:MAG: alpha/beta hydrolase [Notoacmeibacter sp.]